MSHWFLRAFTNCDCLYSPQARKMLAGGAARQARSFGKVGEGVEMAREY